LAAKPVIIAGVWFRAGGEDLGAHVTAGLGPFIVLLGQDSADKTEDGVAGREDAHDVGSAPDFFIQALQIT
jgi:hypothetical protein